MQTNCNIVEICTICLYVYIALINNISVNDDKICKNNKYYNSLSICPSYYK